MVVQLCTVPLLVRLLGLEAYGLWTLITATIGTLVIIEGGLAISTTYFSARALGTGNSRELMETLSVTATLLFVIGLVGALAIWVGADWVADRVIKAGGAHREAAVEALHWSAIVVFARLVQQVPVGLLQAFQRYGLYNVLMLCQTLLTMGSMVVVAARGGGIRELMLVEVAVSGTFLTLFTCVGARLLRGKGAHFAWRWERCREIGRYSVLTWGSTLGAVLFSNGDRLIVGNLLGPGAAAIYAIIVNIVARINQVSALSVQPLMPAVGSGVWQRTPGGGARIAAFAYRTCASVSFTLTLVLISFDSWILQLFVGHPPEPETIWCFRSAVLVYGAYSLNAPGYYFLLGLGHVGKSLLIVMTGGIVALLAIFAGAHWYGLPGAVIGNAGYLLTLSLNPVAAEALGLGMLTWARWAGVPAIWCATGLLLNSASGSLTLKCLLVFLEIGALIIWYSSHERDALRPLLVRMRYALTGARS